MQELKDKHKLIQQSSKKIVNYDYYYHLIEDAKQKKVFYSSFYSIPNYYDRSGEPFYESDDPFLSQLLKQIYFFSRSASVDKILISWLKKNIFNDYTLIAKTEIYDIIDHFFLNETINFFFSDLVLVMIMLN